MGKFWDKIFGSNSDEYMDDYADTEQQEVVLQNDDRAVDSWQEQSPAAADDYRKVVDINSIARSDNYTIKVMHAATIDFAWPICDFVKAGMVVICDVSAVDEKVRQRFRDLISGAVYSMQAHLQNVSPTIFVVAPRGKRLDVETDHTKSRAGETRREQEEDQAFERGGYYR